MSVVARYVQRAYDNRKRALDFDPWLQEGETLDTIEAVITPTTDPALTVTPIVIDSSGRIAAYYVGNGTVGQVYSIAFRSVTSNGQRREDIVEVEVEGDE